MIIFETERLIVREFTKADKAWFFMVNGNEDVMRYIRKALTQEESDNFLNANVEFYVQHPKLGRWCIVEKDQGRFVGTFALIFLPFKEENSNVQIGYALLPEAWGIGYATELTRAGIDYFFKNHASNELHAITTLKNLASQKVLLKCGFTQSGIKKDGEEIVQRFLIKK